MLLKKLLDSILLALDPILLALVEFKEGLQAHYSLCCIANFYLDEALHRQDQRIKRHITGLGHGGYVPCVLCFRARKQTYQRAVTELFLETGFLEDKDFHLLPKHVQALVFYPPKQ